MEAALTPEQETAATAATAAAEATAAEAGWFPLSGRGHAATSLLLQTAPSGPMIPQLFATVQLLEVWCAAGRYHHTGAAGEAKVAGGFDTAGSATLLATLAALRLDPRAGALAPSVDAAAAAILTAASSPSADLMSAGADDNARDQQERKQERNWLAFAALASPLLARVGPTHTSRLAAVQVEP